MSGIIQLLPDNVANQIAAGEVVQRPASVVKELMENAIDAGASQVKVIIRDAGKTLIQIIDNGSGMSPTDARMSFERHATSKIRKSEDLFHIVSKGFRGEALASIAAVAQVELKTRLHGEALGTKIIIEGSRFVLQEPEACAEGSSFSVKNLFFNVPARRYFLKSDAIEFRHIIDEFERVALTHPEVECVLTHNGSDVLNLPKSTIRQRVVHVFGSKYNEKLVPVEEKTDIVSVTGFIGKPEASKKTRGEQFFFVNNRFIRNNYLHHAVMSGFEGLLPSGNYPLYLIYLTIDPAQIDINIHPTKTEIKFQDERAIYAILHAAVRRSLGMHNVAPSLDFDQDASIALAPPVNLQSREDVRIPRIQVNPEYNPFGQRTEKESPVRNWFEQRERSTTGWQELLQITKEVKTETEVIPVPSGWPEPDEEIEPWQAMRKYIIVTSPEGLLVIDQQRAHQRVLFERFISAMEKGTSSSQQLLFPEVITLSAGDDALVRSMHDLLTSLGFHLEEFGGHSWQVTGVPVDASSHGAEKMFDELLAQLKSGQDQVRLNSRDQLAWAMARSSSVRYGQMLTTPEMKELVRQIFACTQPYFTEHQKPTMITIRQTDLDQQFR